MAFRHLSSFYGEQSAIVCRERHLYCISVIPLREETLKIKKRLVLTQNYIDIVCPCFSHL